MRKGEIACYNFSHTVSSLYGSCFSFWMHFKMSSAICFNLDKFKILLSDNGLNLIKKWFCFCVFLTKETFFYSKWICFSMFLKKERTLNKTEWQKTSFKEYFLFQNTSDINPFQNKPFNTCLQYKSFEIILGKGEIVCNAIFNVISVISRWPMHLSMHSWSSFTHTTFFPIPWVL